MRTDLESASAGGAARPTPNIIDTNTYRQLTQIREMARESRERMNLAAYEAHQAVLKANSVLEELDCRLKLLEMHLGFEEQYEGEEHA